MYKRQVLAGYLGYLINGAWTEGIAFNEFMDRFNEVCAVPFANYYNSNTVKAVAIALGIYLLLCVAGGTAGKEKL